MVNWHVGGVEDKPRDFEGTLGDKGGSSFTTETALTASEIVFWLIEGPSLGYFDGRMKSYVGSCGCVKGGGELLNGRG